MNFCEACEAPYPVPMKHTCGKDGFWFTVDSLADALRDNWRFLPHETWESKAADIIQAAKEAERES